MQSLGRPGVLKKGGEALQQYIVEVVLPQLRQVNRATTTQYYEVVRVKLQQTDWGVPLRMHPTWPEVQTLSRKRKTTKSNRPKDLPTRGAQAARREMRQMQLWETRSQDHRAADSSPAGGHSTGNLEPIQTSENQLQQVHRWLAESTQEEIEEISNIPRWKGSTLLRTLHTNKRHRQQQQRRDRLYLQGEWRGAEALTAPPDENTVQTIVKWLH